LSPLYHEYRGSTFTDLKLLIEKLKHVGFVASQSDERLLYNGQSVFALYTDDSILAGPDSKELNSIMEEMKKAELDLLNMEGDVADFLGVKMGKGSAFLNHT
jgi:hypothetical protein